jgi:hypothetical protein
MKTDIKTNLGRWAVTRYLTAGIVWRSLSCLGMAGLLWSLAEVNGASEERRGGYAAYPRRVEAPAVGAPGASYAARDEHAASAAAAPAAAASVAAAGARGAGVAPGVGVGSPGAGVLPRGYVSTVPTGWTKAYYGGYWCAYANGLYYRPIYYQGTVIYYPLSPTPPPPAAPTNSPSGS